jgi:hypothetical protein
MEPKDLLYHTSSTPLDNLFASRELLAPPELGLDGSFYLGINFVVTGSEPPDDSPSSPRTPVFHLKRQGLYGFLAISFLGLDDFLLSFISRADASGLNLPLAARSFVEVTSDYNRRFEIFVDPGYAAFRMLLDRIPKKESDPFSFYFSDDGRVFVIEADSDELEHALSLVASAFLSTLVHHGYYLGSSYLSRSGWFPKFGKIDSSASSSHSPSRPLPLLFFNSPWDSAFLGERRRPSLRDAKPLEVPSPPDKRPSLWVASGYLGGSVPIAKLRSKRVSEPIREAVRRINEQSGASLSEVGYFGGEYSGEKKYLNLFIETDFVRSVPLGRWGNKYVSYRSRSKEEVSSIKKMKKWGMKLTDVLPLLTSALSVVLFETSSWTFYPFRSSEGSWSFYIPVRPVLVRFHQSLDGTFLTFGEGALSNGKFYYIGVRKKVRGNFFHSISVVDPDYIPAEERSRFERVDFDGAWGKPGFILPVPRDYEPFTLIFSGDKSGLSSNPPPVSEQSLTFLKTLEGICLLQLLSPSLFVCAGGEPLFPIYLSHSSDVYEKFYQGVYIPSERHLLSDSLGPVVALFSKEVGGKVFSLFSMTPYSIVPMKIEIEITEDLVSKEYKVSTSSVSHPKTPWMRVPNEEASSWETVLSVHYYY